MKVLLLGEYSGLHGNLNSILKEKNIQSFFCGSPNGFRKLQSDLSFESQMPGILGKLLTALKPICNLHKLSNYDIVQSISYEQFHPLINDLLLRLIFRNCKKRFSLITGCDSFLNDYLSSAHLYPKICEDCLKYDLQQQVCITKGKRATKSLKFICENSEKLIPMQTEYYNAYLNTKYTYKLTEVHRLPIYLKPFIGLKSNKIANKKKIKALHGLNRYGFKGTRIVEECCALIKKRNITNIEIDIKGKMPLNNYIELLKGYDVIIDQLYMESWGYNALFAMASGIPVISCTTRNALKKIGINYNPFISIQPDAESLLFALEHFRDNPKNHREIKEKCNYFIFKDHSHTTVLNQFLSTWEKNA